MTSKQCQHRSRSGEQCKLMAHHDNGTQCAQHATKRLKQVRQCDESECEIMTRADSGKCQRHADQARARRNRTKQKEARALAAMEPIQEPEVIQQIQAPEAIQQIQPKEIPMNIKRMQPDVFDALPKLVADLGRWLVPPVAPKQPEPATFLDSLEWH